MVSSQRIARQVGATVQRLRSQRNSSPCHVELTVQLDEAAMQAGQAGRKTAPGWCKPAVRV